MRTHDYNANIFAPLFIFCRSSSLRKDQVQFLGFNPDRRGANSHVQKMFGFACFLPARADTNRIPNSHPRYHPKIVVKRRMCSDHQISSFVLRHCDWTVKNTAATIRSPPRYANDFDAIIAWRRAAPASRCACLDEPSAQHQVSFADQA